MIPAKPKDIKIIGEMNEKTKKIGLRKVENPVWGFLWRFLLICMIIEGFIWGYFRFVKNVSVLEGIKQMQNSIASSRKKNDIRSTKYIISEDANTKKIESLIQEEKLRKHKEEVEILVQKRIQQEKQIEQQTKKKTLYSWKNASGYRSYSYTGFPENENLIEAEIKYLEN